MGNIEVIKKFIKSSYVLEKAALEIYEGMPLYLRQRIFHGSTLLQCITLLKESEQWDKDRIEAYRLEQTKNLLKHSGEKIPHYRKLFSDYGFNPDKVQAIEDMKILPFLSKETVRDRLDEFVDMSVPRKSLVETSTSGSTGIPLTIFRTKESNNLFLAFRTCLLARIGYTQRCREVMFWSMIELGKYKNLPSMKYGNKLILSIRYLTDEWLFKYVEMIREHNPEFISGSPSTLSILSAFIKDKNCVLSLKNLKAVIVYSETLYDWQRELMGEVLGVRVFSMYAMVELAVIGSECEYSCGLHLHPLYGLTEFDPLDSGYKEIIATGFSNYAMPLIKYRTGDIVNGVKEHCPECNRRHPLVDKITGRMNDFLINKEGEIISRLMPWIRIFPNTRQYQFFQEEPGKAFLRIVRTKTYTESDTNYIQTRLAEMLGPMKDSIDIEIVFIDNIPKTSAGKIKLVDQKLDIRSFLKV